MVCTLWPVQLRHAGVSGGGTAYSLACHAHEKGRMLDPEDALCHVRSPLVALWIDAIASLSPWSKGLRNPRHR